MFRVLLSIAFPLLLTISSYASVCSDLLTKLSISPDEVSFAFELEHFSEASNFKDLFGENWKYIVYYENSSGEYVLRVGDAEFSEADGTLISTQGGDDRLYKLILSEAHDGEEIFLSTSAPVLMNNHSTANLFWSRQRGAKRQLLASFKWISPDRLP